MKNVLDYKDLYMTLFNKISEVYADWSYKIHVFNEKHDGGPKSKINDPIEMLNMMHRMS